MIRDGRRRDGRLGNIIVRRRGVLPPNNMRPEAELVGRGEAEGNLDVSVLLRLATVVVLQSAADGRAHLPVPTPISRLAALVAMMGEVAVRACLDMLPPPPTVVNPFFRNADGMTTGDTLPQ